MHHPIQNRMQELTMVAPKVKTRHYALDLSRAMLFRLLFNFGECLNCQPKAIVCKGLWWSAV